MTFVEKSYKNDHYYISLSLALISNYFIVQVCPVLKDNMCGYPIQEMVYNKDEKQKAMRTFRRYTKKYR